MHINPQEFTFLKDLIKNRSGISLSDDKGYLLESRLLPVIRKRGIKDIAGLVVYLRTGEDEALMVEVVEAMTTNETLFFRDIKPYHFLRDTVLPKLLQTTLPNHVIRIWCAACSSGQEPYSIAITLLENKAKLEGRTFEITATDIDNTILKKAEKGVYSQFEVQRGLPIAQLIKYFKQEGDEWHINPNVKSMIRFKQLNLLDNYSSLKMMDIVFCRNVLIYFEPETKRVVLEKIRNVIAPYGFLFLGSTEGILGVSERFKPYPNQAGAFTPLA